MQCAPMRIKWPESPRNCALVNCELCPCELCPRNDAPSQEAATQLPHLSTKTTLFTSAEKVVADRLAVGETVILLTPPLSIPIEIPAKGRGVQQNDSLADGPDRSKALSGFTLVAFKVSRRRSCHSAAPISSPRFKHLTKREGGAAE